MGSGSPGELLSLMGNARATLRSDTWRTLSPSSHLTEGGSDASVPSTDGLGPATTIKAQIQNAGFGHVVLIELGEILFLTRSQHL